MALFSERNGFIIKPLQIDEMTPELRNRIWNTYNCEICTDLINYFSNYIEEIMDAVGLAFTTIENSGDLITNIKKFHKWFNSVDWYRIYDFIEIYLAFLPPKTRAVAKKNFNDVLISENSGYRIIGDQVVPITNQSEISSIEQAQKTAYSSVNTHMKKAAELFSRRPTPDFENSIKESISAIESMCCIITGESGANATLGNTIKKLKEHGVHIHPAMEIAFLKLYGYTSDENGIRHGGIDFNNASVEDAKYMLVSCSAFVNYLIEKWRKVNPSDNISGE